MFRVLFTRVLPVLIAVLLVLWKVDAADVRYWSERLGAQIESAFFPTLAD